MYVTDPKTGQKSVTLTVFISTAVVAIIKLLVSGVTIYGVSFPAFPGSEFALVLGAAGAIYWGRKNTESKEEHKQE